MQASSRVEELKRKLAEAIAAETIAAEAASSGQSAAQAPSADKISEAAKDAVDPIVSTIVKVYDGLKKKKKKEKKYGDGVLEKYGINEKQRTFCQLFVKYGKAAKAYRLAYGSSPSNKAKNAYRVLAKKGCKDYIKYLRDNAEKRLIRSMATEWQRTLKTRQGIAYCDIADICEDDGTPKKLNEIPVHARKAIKGLKIKKITRASGETVEVTELQIADKNPHLSAIEDKYAVMPDNQKLPVKVDVTTGGRPIASMTGEERRTLALDLLSKIRQRAKEIQATNNSTGMLPVGGADSDTQSSERQGE